MLRYSRPPGVSLSIHPHHQRCTSEPSSHGLSAPVGDQSTKLVSRQAKVATLAARQQSANTAAKTTRLSGRYQKNRSTSTLDRTTTTCKTTAASKASISSTLQQIGDWARRSFRGHGAARGPDGRRPKPPNDYMIKDINSGVIVERKSDKLPTAASRDQSPVATSSGYASGGDGVYSRLHEVDAEDGGNGHAQRAAFSRDGKSRGSRRYRRRASTHEPMHQLDTKPEVILPTTSRVTPEKQIELPVYENLQNETYILNTADKDSSLPAAHVDADISRYHNSFNGNYQFKRETHGHRMSRMPETKMESGNSSLDDYLVAVDRLYEASFVSPNDKSTEGLHRSGSPGSPVYMNGNVTMTSLNQSGKYLHGDTVRQCRSRSLSSSRDRTLTEQASTFVFTGIPQRLSFTPSFVDVSTTSPDPAANADWDDRLSTLSIGCRRPRRSPERRCATQPARKRSTSARRRLPFDSRAVTSVDRRPEAVDESVRPLFAPILSKENISNVVKSADTSVRQQQQPVRLFPGLDNGEESIYETINDAIGRSGQRVSRTDLDGQHVYDNIDDFLLSSSIQTTSSKDLQQQVPPPLPPPPIPARRPAAGLGREMPLCRTDVVDLDSQHVYTIADILDSFDALAEHLPRAQRFIYDLQSAAYLHRRGQLGHEQERDRDRHRVSTTDAGERWIAAASRSREGLPGRQQRRGRSGRTATDSNNSKWCSVPTHRHQTNNSVECQPIVVEDYVCSPGNPVTGERADERPYTETARWATANQKHGLYTSMQAESKSGSGSSSSRRVSMPVDADGDQRFASDRFRRPKLPARRTQKDVSHSMAPPLSRSITHLNRFDDVDRQGKTLNSVQQLQTAINDNLSMLEPHLPPGRISQQTRVMSRSLMEGFSYQPSRTVVTELHDRKQNNRVTSSSVGVDIVSARSHTVLNHPSNDMIAQYRATRDRDASRSASEDRGNRTGSGTKKSSGDDKYRKAGKSVHRSRATDRPTTSGLSRSLMSSAAPPVNHNVADASVQECRPAGDNRRSSTIQWNTSCTGREIFC